MFDIFESFHKFTKCIEVQRHFLQLWSQLIKPFTVIVTLNFKTLMRQHWNRKFSVILVHSIHGTILNEFHQFRIQPEFALYLQPPKNLIRMCRVRDSQLKSHWHSSETAISCSGTFEMHRKNLSGDFEIFPRMQYFFLTPRGCGEVKWYLLSSSASPSTPSILIGAHRANDAFTAKWINRKNIFKCDTHWVHFYVQRGRTHIETVNETCSTVTVIATMIAKKKVKKARQDKYKLSRINDWIQHHRHQ